MTKTSKEPVAMLPTWVKTPADLTKWAKQKQQEPVTGGGNAPRVRYSNTDIAPFRVETTYEVCMDSIEYGSEIFEYDTLPEAYAAVSRLALKCAELNDGVVRAFYVSEA